MKPDRVCSMISLSRKAGKAVSGEFSTETSVKKGKSWLVVIAGDASDNTKKKFENMCTFYEVPYIVYADRAVLGAALGQASRASVSIEDEGLAAAIRKAAGISADVTTALD